MFVWDVHFIFLHILETKLYLSIWKWRLLLCFIRLYKVLWPNKSFLTTAWHIRKYLFSLNVCFHYAFLWYLQGGEIAKQKSFENWKTCLKVFRFVSFPHGALLCKSLGFEWNESPVFSVLTANLLKREYFKKFFLNELTS